MDKKECILEAALKLFVAFGFHGTPTAKIAKEAGVANGTLFHYFPTKDKLIVALYLQIKEKMGCANKTDSIANEPLKTTLKQQYLASLYWALDNKTEFHFIQQFNASPYLAKIASAELEVHLKPFISKLQKGVDEKQIKTLPINLLFTLISSQVYGINQYLIVNELPKAQQHQVINQSFELLWDMIS